jgi:hypothetical protein
LVALVVGEVLCEFVGVGDVTGDVSVGVGDVEDDTVGVEDAVVDVVGVGVGDDGADGDPKIWTVRLPLLPLYDELYIQKLTLEPLPTSEY